MVSEFYHLMAIMNHGLRSVKTFSSPESYLGYNGVRGSSCSVCVKLHENSKVSQVIAAAFCFGIVH